MGKYERPRRLPIEPDAYPQEDIRETDALLPDEDVSFSDDTDFLQEEESYDSNEETDHDEEEYDSDEETDYDEEEYEADEDYEEDEYFEDSPRGVTTKQKVILVSVCAGVLVLLIGLIVGIVIFSGRDTDDDLILDNVYAGEVNLGGMTMEEAKGALHLATDRTFSKKDMVVQVYEGMSFSLSPENTGASLNVDAVVKAAYDYGRGGSEADFLLAKRKAASSSYTIALLPYLRLDLDYIRQTVEEYCAANNSELTQPIISLKGTRPTYDPNAINQSTAHQSLQITLGTPYFQLDANSLYERILDAYSMNNLLVVCEDTERTEPDPVTAEALFSQFCTASKDASIDPATYELTPEVYGYGFNVAAVQQQLDSKHYGDSLEIEFEFLIPGVLTEHLTENLFLDTLGEYRSSYDPESEERIVNLKLACDIINNHVINAGETFSFNKVLGEISESNGFVTAPVSGYNGTALGGGVTQVSSALYYSVLMANFDVVERHSHDFAVDFIDFGLDAYVDGRSKDLRFRNTSTSPVRIVAQIQENAVFVELQGANTLGYTTKIISTVLSKVEPAVIEQRLEPDNLSGYRDGDVIQSGIPGYKVAVYMEKYDPLTNALLSSLQVSTSDYRKIDTIIVKIEEPATEPPTQLPEQPEEPITETQEAVLLLP